MSRPRHIVRWVVIGVFVSAFAAQCAIVNWPKTPPAEQGTASQRVLDLPGYSSDGSLEHPTSVDSAQVTDLLNLRAKAVLAGDEKMFMRSVDTADTAFAAAQRVVFANTREFPLVRFSYSLGDAIYPDHTLHTPSYVAEVTTSYQLHGYDSASSAVEDGYTFVKLQGQWRLDSVSEADHQFEQHALPPLWDGPPISTYGDGQYLAVVNKGARTLAHQLIRLCQRGAQASHDLLGVSNDRSTVLVATTTQYGFNRYSGPDAAAITYPAYDGANIVGWRMKINPTYVAEVLRDPVVLTHELTHLATQEYLATSPNWLSEGTAEYVAWHRLGGVRASYLQGTWQPTTPPPPALPLTAGFYLGDTSQHYLESQALVSYIVATYGKAALMRLFRAYLAAGDRTVNVDTHSQEILWSVLHVRQAQLAQQAYAALLSPTGGTGS